MKLLESPRLPGALLSIALALLAALALLTALTVAQEEQASLRSTSVLLLAFLLVVLPLLLFTAYRYHAVVEDFSRRKRTEARIQAYQERLRALAADLTVTEERERRRIAGELHDGAVQALASARMRLDTAVKRGGTGEPAGALHEVSESLRQTALLANQIASNLSSPSLSELGLAAAISEWMKEQVGGRFGIETELVNQLEEEDRKSLDFVTRALLFRSVRELLANVVQHAHATKVGVLLRRSVDDLELVVRDDGQGCAPEEALESGGGEGGIGLFSIRERMADLGGALRIESEPGHGFTATLVIPLPPGRRPEKG